MADDPKPDGRGKSPGSQEVLRANAFKPGQSGNPKGTNSWRKYQAKISSFYAEIANAGSDQTRFERVMLAGYTSALMPGPKGAMDRKLIHEQCAGRAKQQVEVTGDGGSALRVVAVIPDNGHGPDEPEDAEDGQPSPVDT